MPIFYCKMTEPGGRIVEETITADSKAILIKRLKKEGNFVLEIRREEEFGSLKKEISRRRIKANDLLSFNREFWHSGNTLISFQNYMLLHFRQERKVVIYHLLYRDISNT